MLGSCWLLMTAKKRRMHHLWKSDLVSRLSIARSLNRRLEVEPQCRRFPSVNQMHCISMNYRFCGVKLKLNFTETGSNLYTRAATVTAGFICAPETIPKILTSTMTAKPNVRQTVRRVGLWCSKPSTHPMQPIKTSRPVAMSSERNNVSRSKCDCFMTETNKLSPGN